MLNSRHVIENSNIAFGTSGARGLVIDFKSEVCAAFAHAFIDVMADDFTFDTVALAIDNRPSSYAMAQACAQAIIAKGLKVVYFGVVPTPALANQSMQDKIPAIMVTGSHIPFDRNGLKFYRPDGEITKADELGILQRESAFRIALPLPVLNASSLAAENYMARYTSLFAADTLAGKRIGVYEHSSAGRDIYAKMLTQLGADVISIGRSDEFVPIDTEAVAEEDKEKARQWARKFKLDAIFSTDGDGDRPLVADEQGEWLRGDILGLLCAKAMSIDALAIPVSCNTAISKSCLFKHIELTKIGSPYVIEAFARLSDGYARIAGFEANGGFLLGSDVTFDGNTITALPTRDAVLPFLMVFASAVTAKVPMSHLLHELPQRYTHSDRIQNFATALSKNIIADALQDPITFVHSLGFSHDIKGIDTTDGLRITFSDDAVIHLRPSGNAPELRCYSESGSATDAATLVEYTLSHLKRLSL
ncbi:MULTISPECIES: phosphomannomutase [Enterobacteriaceae]|jgi:phosphomannomutase|uniref:phosphomannomutase n=1 Tax=Enterobacteriaceae TaxID=543 RepID=UPI000CF16B86|nr:MULTISPECIES: phosphomannomutase [Enterobacteriaceae]MCU3195206.1 phosphomannomutase [Enterobacter hormaechei subsp. hoffmannii]HED2223108.1 phosphomannomutase [Enterobacter hormaechei subsp. steigerwaltii]ELM8953717.1 phosphomannomutase [Escherichia coli]MBK0349152.1 phosphomannomutase [Leclercia adecarboxylata]MCU3508060.1 phosphomannomutase [Enterobacter hormaechei subsp. hoffmannii]